ncbi:DUF3488 and transglutaminase-like domain-containing protein [Bacillus sp. PK3-056]|uniref:transglutaminase TgpA family protein n=1 Tax=Niallia circulans TaxID=1397 RepID=UPI000F450682|nr:transglutaminaseTgpA domain-containing protein [Niallia circulans]AYV72374.1 transglutaminase [Niallia circulans]
MGTPYSKQHITIANFLLYILGFLLICEWLGPLEALTNTENVIVFHLFLALSLLLAFFRTPSWVSGTLKTVYIIFILQYLYYEESFFTFQWIQPFAAEFIDNLALVFNTKWPEMTNMFKSSLCFILLWLMAYLIDYWLIKRRKIFTFFLLTIIYITVLDTFTIYSADAAIIRTVIIGFTAMGMLTFFRLSDKEGARNTNSSIVKWMIPLLLFVIGSAGIGYLSPKADPIWPDPVPFIQTMGDKGGEEDGDIPGSGVHRVGYSVDDSRLGGDFIGDSSLVFVAEVEEPHYWKVETKDTYTGKGWVQSEESLKLNRDNFEVLDQGGEIPFVSFVEGENVKRTESESTVQFTNGFSYLLYPLGVKEVSAANSFMEIESGNERGVFNGYVESYSVKFDVPEYSLNALTTADMEDFIRNNPDMVKRYLQLPDSLPQRVKDLAVDITKNDENIFAKVRAIETYFSSNGFAYSQNNVAVPNEEEDYVDQFLFETKLGYCDNYSTSMVTLLRSIGIPSRWVKGFTEGEFVEADGDIRRYEVTNNNAHSWVEVYFPEVGWVSFEPTQGFSNANTYINDVESNRNTENNETQTPEEKAQQPKTPEQKPETPEQTIEQASPSTEGWESYKTTAKENWQWVTIVLVIIITAGLAAYKFRYKWLPYYYIWKFRNTTEEANFPKAYMVLLHLLEIAGLRKKEEITLREYAKQIDHIYSSEEMSQLTAKYEEYLYKGYIQKETWEDVKELWENLIKKTTA